MSSEIPLRSADDFYLDIIYTIYTVCALCPPAQQQPVDISSSHLCDCVEGTTHACFTIHTRAIRVLIYVFQPAKKVFQYGRSSLGGYDQPYAWVYLLLCIGIK